MKVNHMEQKNIKIVKIKCPCSKEGGSIITSSDSQVLIKGNASIQCGQCNSNICDWIVNENVLIGD